MMIAGTRRTSSVGLIALLLTSCASYSPPKVVSRTSLRLSPAQAVMNAAEMPEGVAGVFEFVVRTAGRQDGMLYLNSEQDYRDPRNMTIDVAPDVERELSGRIGGPLESAILNKTVAVRGTAKKTRIVFLSNGRQTGKYYFQTHLRLQSARDMTIEGERPVA
jgi:hypothetical protein